MVALVTIDVVGPTVYGVGVPAAAAVLYLATRSRACAALRRSLVDRQDLVVVGALYLAVVALFRVAFEGFGTGRVAGLFLTFAAGSIEVSAG